MVVVVLEGERGPAMLEKRWSAAAGFITQAARREIAGQDRGRALAVDRIRERVDDVGQIDLRAFDVLAQRPTP